MTPHTIWFAVAVELIAITSMVGFVCYNCLSTLQQCIAGYLVRSSNITLILDSYCSIAMKAAWAGFLVALAQLKVEVLLTLCTSQLHLE
jgi:hypothetical protein